MELGLRESIENLVIAPQADAVTEIAQLHSALGAKLSVALAELDRRGEFELEGYASMTAWCRSVLGWTNQTQQDADDEEPCRGDEADNRPGPHRHRQVHTLPAAPEARRHQPTSAGQRSAGRR